MQWYFINMRSILIGMCLKICRHFFCCVVMVWQNAALVWAALPSVSLGRQRLCHAGNRWWKLLLTEPGKSEVSTRCTFPVKVRCRPDRQRSVLVDHTQDSCVRFRVRLLDHATGSPDDTGLACDRTVVAVDTMPQWVIGARGRADVAFDMNQIILPHNPKLIR